MDELVAKIKLLEDEIKAAVEILTLDDGTNGEFGDVFAEMRSLVRDNVQELQELQDAKLAQEIAASTSPTGKPVTRLDVASEALEQSRRVAADKKIARMSLLFEHPVYVQRQIDADAALARQLASQ